MPIAATNDFVVKFANVNGSGSASANELFARCILRMGVPVASRNIFPSNIQGLPTWYEVRVPAKAGWAGAAAWTSWSHEPADLGQGCRVDRSGRLSRSTIRPSRCRASKFRDDLTVLGVPLTLLCQFAGRHHPARAAAAQERHLSRRAVLAARLRGRSGRKPDRRAVQGQGQAHRA